MARLLTELKSFLKTQLRVPFEYGKSDCATWVSTWVYNMTGVDPAATLRETYTNEIGCARILAHNGGLLSIMDTYMMQSGVMYRAYEPFNGDVAVVTIQTDTSIEEVAALRTSNGWAYKPARGGLNIYYGELPVKGLWRMKISSIERHLKSKVDVECLQ